MSRKKCYTYPWCACGVADAETAVELGSYNLVTSRDGGGVNRIPAVEVRAWAAAEELQREQYGVGCSRRTE